MASVTSENWGMPEGCHETSYGGFYRAVIDSRRAFRRQGWKEIDGEWWCPVCAKLLGEQK